MSESQYYPNGNWIKSWKGRKPSMVLHYIGANRQWWHAEVDWAVTKHFLKENPLAWIGA